MGSHGKSRAQEKPKPLRWSTKLNRTWPRVPVGSHLPPLHPLHSSRAGLLDFFKRSKNTLHLAFEFPVPLSWKCLIPSFPCDSLVFLLASGELSPSQKGCLLHVQYKIATPLLSRCTPLNFVFLHSIFHHWVNLTYFEFIYSIRSRSTDCILP